MQQRHFDLRAEARDWARTLAYALAVYCTLTTVALAQYSIPSESMVPTLEVGDRILVSKFAYGYSRYSLPLGLGRFLPKSDARLFGRMPERGDVVVFVHPQDGRIIVKRLIGLPGDEITIRDGVVAINGHAADVSEPEPLVRRAQGGFWETAVAREEHLPGGRAHVIHEIAPESPIENFGPYRVPQGHVFFMGDNRDNSADSRTLGMGPVPIENIVGRVETVVFAPRGCAADDAACRQRWLQPTHD
jgi:signal peptidase I